MSQQSLSRVGEKNGSEAGGAEFGLRLCNAPTRSGRNVSVSGRGYNQGSDNTGPFFVPHRVHVTGGVIRP